MAHHTLHVLFFALFFLVILPTVFATCDGSIDLDVREEPIKIIFKPLVGGVDTFLIEYWIEDANATILKKKLNTSNTLTKTYTRKTQEPIFIKAKLFPECDDTHQENNVVTKKIAKDETSYNARMYLFSDKSDTIQNTQFEEKKTVRNYTLLQKEMFEQTRVNTTTHLSRTETIKNYFFFILLTFFALLAGVLLWKR